jgi:hypothetical protein
MFSVIFISKNYISLQAPCLIFTERAARFEQRIYHSIHSVVSIQLIYLGWHASLWALIIIVFRVFDRIMSYDHSKCAIEMKAFEHPNFWESKMCISWFLRRQSKSYSLGIIWNAILFVFKFQFLCFPSYPRATYFRNRVLRISLVWPRGLENQFLFPLTLIFTLTLSI